jgi:hypothetical protein
MAKSKSSKYGVHGTFLKMHNVESNFNRTPMLPHQEPVVKIHPSHRHII